MPLPRPHPNNLLLYKKNPGLAVTVMSHTLGAGHQNVVVRTEYTSNALKDPAEPVNVDHVEYDARAD